MYSAVCLIRTLVSGSRRARGSVPLSMDRVFVGRCTWSEPIRRATIPPPLYASGLVASHTAFACASAGQHEQRFMFEQSVLHVRHRGLLHDFGIIKNIIMRSRGRQQHHTAYIITNTIPNHGSRPLALFPQVSPLLPDQGAFSWRLPGRTCGPLTSMTGQTPITRHCALTTISSATSLVKDTQTQRNPKQIKVMASREQSLRATR